MKKFFLFILQIPFFLFFFLLSRAEPFDQQGPPAQQAWSVTDVPYESGRINWYLRQKLRQEAGVLYQKILALCEEISNAIKLFEGKRDELNKSIILTSKDLFTRAEKNKKNFDRLASYIEKANILIVNFGNVFEDSSVEGISEQKNEYDLQVLQYVRDIDFVKEQFEDFNKNFSLFQSADKTLSQGVEVIVEQEKKIKGVESQAWAIYQKLDELISDQQAQDLMAEMRAYTKSAEQVRSYLYGSFLNFFNKLLVEVNKGTTSLQSLLVTVSDEQNRIDVSISKVLKELEEKIEAEEGRKVILKKEEAEANKRKLALKEKELELLKRPWYIKVYDWIESIYVSVSTYITSFFSSKKDLNTKNSKKILDSSDDKKEKEKKVESKVVVPKETEAEIRAEEIMIEDEKRAIEEKEIQKEEAERAEEPPVSSSENPYEHVGKQKAEALAEQKLAEEKETIVAEQQQASSSANLLRTSEPISEKQEQSVPSEETESLASNAFIQDTSAQEEANIQIEQQKAEDAELKPEEQVARDLNVPLDAEQG